ncbi:polysaccharide deacetylase family protein [Pseudonocardia sp. RS11V-5]|uniref:polysaccharide deacetylase family protein n=1 Tax=Pseudonocardia terrae TaxID=2905831 RepID=UPI001E345F66|nr:polysaccharide deacetylase family protein [Pseudonocardia terrae]MCE3553491.1 polysaccharide deacetylase family protein [Pseudonocardia terrae]
MSQQITDVVAPASPGDLVERLRTAPTSAQNGPIILTYHDVGHSSSPYTLAPENFASQMRLLRDAGWTTVGSAQIEDWLQGKPFPPHAVAITFDDGARGVWKYADPILAANGQRAIAFIITGFVGTRAPYYMTWAELAQMQASGRWDLEAHTHVGHVQVPTDAAGDQGPFLTSREYLPALGRAETLDEYVNRVRSDLAESKRQLVAHGFPEPRLFAYPFSAYAQDDTGSHLTDIVKSLFDAAMLDQAGVAASTSTADLADRHLTRMDTTADESLEGWTDKLIQGSPLDPADSTPFSRPESWAAPNESPLPLTVVNQSAVLDPNPGEYTSRMFAPVQTRLWRKYTVDADLGNFREPDDGTTTGLIALAQDPQQLEVAVGAANFQVTEGGAENSRMLASGALPVQVSHHVTIKVETESALISVDGRQVLSVALRPAAGGFGPAGGIALSANRSHVASPVPVVSRLTVS